MAVFDILLYLALCKTYPLLLLAIHVYGITCLERISWFDLELHWKLSHLSVLSTSGHCPSRLFLPNTRGL